MDTRREAYERKRKQLLEWCGLCTTYNSPTPECCEYSCSTGKKLRQIEIEYADVTGWGHDKTWKKEV